MISRKFDVETRKDSLSKLVPGTRGPGYEYQVENQWVLQNDCIFNKWKCSATDAMMSR